MNGYFNNLTFILLIAAGLFMVSCDNNNNDELIRVLIEDDFANDSLLSADPSSGVVVTFLEHPEDSSDENITGDPGVDIIPIRYEEPANHTFCWEDSNDQSEHFITFNRISGEEIFRVEANGDCITQFIEAGIYELQINHDGIIETTFPIFIQNDSDLIQVENIAVNKLLSGFLEKIGFIQNAVAQSVSDNFNTLINTNSCPGCNLTGVGLSFKDLSGADLNGANLSFSQMIETNLTGADLSDSNLNNADLTGANLTNADISGASTSNTTLTGATLTGITI